MVHFFWVVFAELGVERCGEMESLESEISEAETL
jgi:hypothetical protein